ncbi:MAG: thiamine-phosphate pyrophosphorylase [Candidatus Omnitrophota bacterium]|nr:thiamine-phosphate pyrophosphorylase [Candidatus Omnitrophota bacterium]
MRKLAKRDVMRVIDANLNRSREALRVCEDIARFAMNSRALTSQLKSVRHAVSGIAKSSAVPLKALPASRDSEGDCLRRSRFESEMKRDTLSDIFAANIERAKESLRVLEELFKLIDTQSSSKFCGLRYKVYTIEKRGAKRLNDAD